jgi:GNAT superfamily N-acetyltransferase
MEGREYRRDGFLISTDRSRLDVDAIHRFLSRDSYWAVGRSREAVQRSIEGSLCFGVFDPQGKQAGFARVVTDFITFGWLCDVFVLDAYRGKSLGKWLVQTVVETPELKDVKRLLLGTRDAHELYQRYGGFTALAAPERWMERVKTSP